MIEELRGELIQTLGQARNLAGHGGAGKRLLIEIPAGSGQDGRTPASRGQDARKPRDAAGARLWAQKWLPERAANYPAECC